MPRPCYYLVGPTGFPNYGDELVARAWLRYLAKVAPDADVWLDCHSPGPALTLLAGEHPRVRFVDTLWRLAWDAPSEEPWELAARTQQAVHDPTVAPRWAAGVELLGRADIVHVMGGGYINEIWPRHIGLVAGAAAAAQRSGGSAVMTGVGLTPPVPGSERLLQALADRFRVVDVRDSESAELLGRPEAHGVDDVFLDLGEHLLDITADTPRYMLCLQADLVDGSPSRLAGYVLATLRDWDVEPAQVAVVEGIPGSDHKIYDLLRHELPGVRIIPFSEVWARGLPARPGQIWISTRFHVHLVAAAAGAAGVAVTVKPGYYSTKHYSLIELGTGWELAEDFDVLPRRPTEQLGGDVFAQARQRKLAVADQVYRSGDPQLGYPAAGHDGRCSTLLKP